MEEATERLVKLYLESKDFFLRTNEKIKLGKNRYPEIDIIAVRIKKNKKDDLPNRIIGEVKSWELKLLHFPNLKNKEMYKKYKGRFKVFFEYRKESEKIIEKKYGKGFKFYIFSRDYQKKKNSYEISKKLKKWDTKFISLEKIAEEIVQYSQKFGYSNDPELQVLRILKTKK